MRRPRAHPDPVSDPGFETLAQHFGEDPQKRAGAAAPAIHQTSTFILPDAETFARRTAPDSEHYDYTRVGNPTTDILEAKLARMEHGAWARCFGSGMGAVTAALHACLSGGDHVVCVQHVYGPARTYLNHLKRFAVETTFVPGVSPEDFVAAMRPNTRVLYLESPTSGYFECPPIEPLTAAARQRGITTIFDNSWATPCFMTPLDFGVDLVLHSATKYLNGHSDVVAGVVIGRAEELLNRVHKEYELLGATLDPFAAWLMIRGLRTLALRMEQHQRSGLAVARALESQPKVARVIHPGLPSHPQHEIGRRQFRGYAGLFSLVLKEQTQAATHSFLNRVKLFRQGVSWGGFESLAVGGQFFGVDPTRPEWLIRLHCGLESTDDLVAAAVKALEDR